MAKYPFQEVLQAMNEANRLKAESQNLPTNAFLGGANQLIKSIVDRRQSREDEQTKYGHELNKALLLEQLKNYVPKVSRMAEGYGPSENRIATRQELMNPESKIDWQPVKQPKNMVQTPIFQVKPNGTMEIMGYYPMFEGSRPIIVKGGQTITEALNELGKYQGTSGGDIPPGTVVQAGGVSVPVNPKLTDEARTNIVGGQQVSDTVQQIKNLISVNPDITNLGSMLASKSPYTALAIAGKTGVIGKQNIANIEEMKRLRGQLEARIPFAKGGKQLTPFEAKVLFDLMPQPGQSPQTIERNLDTLIAEFNKLGQLALEGRRGAMGNTQTTPQATPTQKRFVIEQVE